MADGSTLLMLAAAVAEHGAGAGAGHEVEPAAFGLGPTVWVALSMSVLIAIMLWKKVPGIVTGSLDASIVEIRKQLDEAKTLRAEAEALRTEYATRIANAEKDAVAMLDHARHEADAIVAKAETDTAAVVARREKMAEDKIAAAERAAITELRARAASAATVAARGLIRGKHSPDADRGLVDEAISAL